MRRCADVCIAITCALVCTWASIVNGVVAGVAAPSEPLQGNVTPAIDSVQGRVAVVASSALTDGKVAVIVENGTARPRTALRVVGTATAADRSRVIRASTRTTTPVTLAPRGLALAVLTFRRSGVPPGAKMSFRVAGHPLTHATDPGTLEPGEFQLSPPLGGRVVQRLDMTLTNPSRHTLRGRARVITMCFDEARKPSTATTIVVRLHKLPPGRTRHVTVPFATLCPTYLVGAHTA